MTRAVSIAEVDKRAAALLEACRQSGLRMTSQRQEIFLEVAKTGEHPDAETIFQRVRARLPNISLDTVYRNLAQLERLGMLSRVDPLCGRARFDANSDSHHHFICVDCEAIIDIYLDNKEQIEPPRAASALGDIQSLHLQVRGRCAACRKKQTGPI